MFQTPELIITDELRDLLFSTKDATPLQTPFLHKRYRRDFDGGKLPCPSCNAGISGTREGRKGCPYCKGDGYLWDELIIEGWLFRANIRTAISSYDMPTQAGIDLNKEIRFLTMPEIFINEGDIISKIKIGTNKKISIPLTRHEEYLCYFSERFASNQSDSEFNIAGLKV